MKQVASTMAALAQTNFATFVVAEEWSLFKKKLSFSSGPNFHTTPAPGRGRRYSSSLLGSAMVVEK
jgi:hypothetical protein